MKPKRYIGGSPEQARQQFWDQDSILRNAIDSISAAYGLYNGALMNRLNREGFVDKTIKLINNTSAINQHKYFGRELLQNTEYSGPKDFGLDDGVTMINDGRVKLINENWYDEDFTNEKGRLTHGSTGATVSDNIGIKAATLKYFTDQAKKDYPNISDYEAARYGQAYYNRGVQGGRDWVKSGAKGYRFKTNAAPKMLKPKTYIEPYNWNNNKQQVYPLFPLQK